MGRVRDWVKEAVFGHNLAPRDQAGRMLGVFIGIATIFLVSSAMIGAMRHRTGLGEEATQLLLGVLSLLVGTVSGYLARRQDRGLEDDARTPVGVLLTFALGLSLVIITGVSLWDAIFSPTPAMSTNLGALLSAVLGGSIGAAAAYLGLPGHQDPLPPPRDPPPEA